MNIKDALKLKNKLVGQIAAAYDKANRYNSIVEGNDRPYEPKEALEEWKTLSDKLVDLKTKIHKANVPVLDKIFRLSEMKNQAKMIKSLNTLSGQVVERYGSGTTINYTTVINVVEQEKMVKELEEEIEQIQ